MSPAVVEPGPILQMDALGVIRHLLHASQPPGTQGDLTAEIRLTGFIISPAELGCLIRGKEQNDVYPT